MARFKINFPGNCITLCIRIEEAQGLSTGASANGWRACNAQTAVPIVTGFYIAENARVGKIIECRGSFKPAEGCDVLGFWHTCPFFCSQMSKLDGSTLDWLIGIVNRSKTHISPLFTHPLSHPPSRFHRATFTRNFRENLSRFQAIFTEFIKLLSQYFSGLFTLSAVLSMIYAGNCSH